jgi:hypothetical protein
VQHVVKPSHQPLPALSPVPAYVPPAVHHSANSGPFLKKCAADWCSNKAHYDSELGPFDYCTPQCRDRHLLPQEQKRLREEISENTAKMMISNFPPSPHTVLGTANSPTCSNTVPSYDSVVVPLADEKKMVTISKRPKEPLGIIAAQIPNETGLRIVGVEIGTPAHHEMKQGNINFLDHVTQLNEDKILSREWFEQSTRDKTRPELTLWRSRQNLFIRPFLTKVQNKCSLATHIRLILNPFHFQIGTDFGLQPVQTTVTLGVTTGITGVRANSSAHLSGVTVRDEILMYGTMGAITKVASEPKVPTLANDIMKDFDTALVNRKHLVLVLRRQPIQY